MANKVSLSKERMLRHMIDGAWAALFERLWVTISSIVASVGVAVWGAIVGLPGPIIATMGLIVLGVIIMAINGSIWLRGHRADSKVDKKIDIPILNSVSDIAKLEIGIDVEGIRTRTLNYYDNPKGVGDKELSIPIKLVPSKGMDLTAISLEVLGKMYLANGFQPMRILEVKDYASKFIIPKDCVAYAIKGRIQTLVDNRPQFSEWFPLVFIESHKQ